MKRELAVLARQNRPVYVEKSSPSGQTEHDGDVLRALSERLMELQGEQQRLATKVEQSQAAVVDELNRKQVNGRPGLETAYCQGLGLGLGLGQELGLGLGLGPLL